MPETCVYLRSGQLGGFFALFLVLVLFFPPLITPPPPKYQASNWSENIIRDRGNRGQIAETGFQQ